MFHISDLEIKFFIILKKCKRCEARFTTNSKYSLKDKFSVNVTPRSLSEDTRFIPSISFGRIDFFGEFLVKNIILLFSLLIKALLILAHNSMFFISELRI